MDGLAGKVVALLDPFIPAYKIGSGDITWTQFVEVVAKKGKPVLLATGAATMEDVERAVETILTYNRQIVLLQCNTNYTVKRDELPSYQFESAPILCNSLSSYAARAF